MWGSGGEIANLSNVIYQFGEYQLEPARFELRQGERSLSVEPQVFQLLCLLIEHRHRVVSREELLDQVWQSRFVNDSTLSHRVMEARRIIGDDGKRQGKIRTVRGRGFRFVDQVTEHSREPQPKSSTCSAWHTPSGTGLPEGSVLLGRDNELQTLEGHLDQVRLGMRRLVFVTGEAGIGKTSLVEAFLQNSEIPFAQGHCLEHFGHSEPYLPVLDALGHLCRGPLGKRTLEVLRQYGPSWLSQLPAHQSCEDKLILEQTFVGLSRERMLREMGETLEALTQDHPLILLLEDLHWSDPSTLDLLAWIAQRKLPAKLMLLATVRPFEAAVKNQAASMVFKSLTLRGQALELALSGLSDEAMLCLLKQRGCQVSERARELVLQAGGNPLYVHCLLSSWGEQPICDQGKAHFHTSLPESIRELIEQQIVHLSTKERKTLEAASLLKREFSAAAVSCATELEPQETEVLCSNLVRKRGFLTLAAREPRADGAFESKFAFTHALVREAIQSTLAPGRRAAMHARIAEQLEALRPLGPGEHAAEIARHYELAGRPEKAIPHLISAAQRALRYNAPEEAGNLIEEAFELLKKAPDLRSERELEFELYLLRSSAGIARSGWSDPNAELSYLRAYELSSELPRQARPKVALGLATLYEMRGEYHRCQALVEANLAGLSDKIGAHELLACSLYHQGDFTSALEHAERGLSLYDTRCPLDLPMASYGDNPLVSCRAWAFLCLAYLGEARLAESRLEHTLALVQTHELSFSSPLALVQGATLYQILEQPTDSLKWAERALDAARRFGFAHLRAAAEILAGWANSQLSCPQEGMARIVRGLEAYTATGARIDLPYFLMLQAQIAILLGERQMARRALLEALDFTKDGRRLNVEAEIFRLMGELEPVESESWYQRAMEAAKQQKAKVLLARIPL